MTPAALWDTLRRRGVCLSIEGDRLRYEAAPDALTPDVLEAMRGQNGPLLVLLQGADVEAGPEWRPRLGESLPAVWNDGRCVRCNGRRWRWSMAAGRWECADAECEAKGRRLWGKGA